MTIPKAFATKVQRIRWVCWAVVALGVLLVAALWAMDAGQKPEKRNGSFRLVEKKTLSCGVKVWFYVPAYHILGDDFVGRVTLRNLSQKRLLGHVGIGASAYRNKLGDVGPITSQKRHVELEPDSLMTIDHVLTEREYLPILDKTLGVHFIPSVRFEGDDDSGFITIWGMTRLGVFPCEITTPTGEVKVGDILPIKVCFLNTLSCNLTNTTLYFELDAVSGDKEVKIGNVHKGERVTVEREFRALKSREGTIHVSIEAKELRRHRLKSLDILVN